MENNNIVIIGIANDISDNQLEEAVLKFWQVLIVIWKRMILRLCHKFGKSYHDRHSKKTIICFPHKKSDKKAMPDKKNVTNINSEEQFFNRNNKLINNENLTNMNENLACHGKKLNRLILSCFTRDGIVHIKRNEYGKSDT